MPPLPVATGAVGEATEGKLVRIRGTITQPVENDLPYRGPANSILALPCPWVNTCAYPMPSHRLPISKCLKMSKRTMQLTQARR